MEPKLLIMPAPDEVLGVGHAVTDETDIEYNMHCTALLRERLMELKASGVAQPLVLTQYPHDTVDDEIDSRDLVSLDEHDDILIVSTGDPS